MSQQKKEQFCSLLTIFILPSTWIEELANQVLANQTDRSRNQWEHAGGGVSFLKRAGAKLKKTCPVKYQEKEAEQ